MSSSVVYFLTYGNLIAPSWTQTSRSLITSLMEKGKSGASWSGTLVRWSEAYASCSSFLCAFEGAGVCLRSGLAFHLLPSPTVFVEGWRFYCFLIRRLPSRVSRGSSDFVSFVLSSKAGKVVADIFAASWRSEKVWKRRFSNKAL